LPYKKVYFFFLPSDSHISRKLFVYHNYVEHFVTNLNEKPLMSSTVRDLVGQSKHEMCKERH